MACRGYPRNGSCEICGVQIRLTSPFHRFCEDCAKEKRKRDQSEAYHRQKEVKQRDLKINKKEKRIIQYVVDNPGCSFHDIQKKFKVANAEGIIIRLENMGTYFYDDDDGGLHHIGAMR